MEAKIQNQIHLESFEPSEWTVSFCVWCQGFTEKLCFQSTKRHISANLCPYCSPLQICQQTILFFFCHSSLLLRLCIYLFQNKIIWFTIETQKVEVWEEEERREFNLNFLHTRFNLQLQLSDLVELSLFQELTQVQLFARERNIVVAKKVENESKVCGVSINKISTRFVNNCLHFTNQDSSNTQEQSQKKRMKTHQLSPTAGCF